MAETFLEIVKKKAGRPPKFATADELLAAFAAYVEWANDNPIQMVQRFRKKGKRDSVDAVSKDEGSIPRPLSVDGFCFHSGIVNWTEFRRSNKERDGFGDAIGYIERTIRSQQIDGATAGIYNAGLVARLNGIAENVNTTIDPPVFNVLPIK